jgi:hypothetical protein
VAAGVTQIWLRGMWPSSTVQADWHGPTICTSTPRAARPAQRASYSVTLPPWLSETLIVSALSGEEAENPRSIKTRQRADFMAIILPSDSDRRFLTPSCNCRISTAREFVGEAAYAASSRLSRLLFP